MVKIREDPRRRRHPLGHGHFPRARTRRGRGDDLPAVSHQLLRRRHGGHRHLRGEAARGADGCDVYVRRALPQRHHARHGARGAVTSTAKSKQLRSQGFAAVFALTGAGCAGCGHSAAAKSARRPTAASCRD